MQLVAEEGDPRVTPRGFAGIVGPLLSGVCADGLTKRPAQEHVEARGVLAAPKDVSNLISMLHLNETELTVVGAVSGEGCEGFESVSLIHGVENN